jgi:GTPase
MKVNGNIGGIKTFLLDKINEIYNIKIDNSEFITYELMFLLAEYSAEINREISVYISRTGKVCDVSIGSSSEVALPFLRLRRGLLGLSGVRCIHTHPGGSPMPSSVDIGTLLSSRLDAMAAIGITKTGRVSGLGIAVIGKDLNTPKLLGPYKVKEIPIHALMQEIESATERVKQSVALTETKDMSENAILVGLNASEQSMHELSRLAKTAGANVIYELQKTRPSRDRKFYIGKGNINELNLLVSAKNADMVITNDELSPLEQTTIEETLCIKVIDRTTLILDIFASHAKTKEGSLQVELAQLKYALSRLAGEGINLSRLGGGIGTRGPGESKLETDRRRMNRKIFELEREITKLKSQRKVRRQTREKSGLPVVALAGYTNAGKSTLLNRLSGSAVLAEDKLFATLDPVTRKVIMPSSKTVLFSDTVGFIDKLPHDLIAAFEATLEETALADLVINVIDASDPNFMDQRDIVRDVLYSLGVVDENILEVYNKSDLLDIDAALKSSRIYISAQTNDGIEEMLNTIEVRLKPSLIEAEIKVPYNRGDVLAYIQNNCENPVLEYKDEHTLVKVHIKQIFLNKALSMLK